MSKAETLNKLSNNLGYIIDPFIQFKVKEWIGNSEAVLERISSQDYNTYVVVRSSALFEDDDSRIAPGEFYSELNVSINSPTQIRGAIDKVIDSYYRNIIATKNFLENEVIIQQQLIDPTLSGVIDASNAFYYSIEFDDETKTTDTVTSGKSCKKVDILRNYNNIYHPWQTIVNAIKSVEKILHWDYFLIEFGVDKSEQVHVFQVKEIKSLLEVNITYNSLEEELAKCHDSIKLFYKQSSIWSDMTDWNPVEMLGDHPRPLSTSLYEHVITNDSWSKARASLGYKDMTSNKLLHVFGSKPYINIALSFFSLIPSSLKDKIAKEILRIQMSFLRERPYLHDKVEFEVLFTCGDVVTPSRTNKLLDFGLSIKHLKLYNNALDNLSRYLLKNYLQIYDTDYGSINSLLSWRKTLSYKISNAKSLQDKIYLLMKCLKICKDIGAVPFAKQARLAFIGKDMMQRLFEVYGLDDNYITEFWKSFNTITDDLSKSLFNLINNEISQNEFRQLYGHLRPSTYDIESHRYDQVDFDQIMLFSPIDNENRNSKKGFKNRDSLIKEINLIFKSIDYLEGIEGENFLDFVKKSTQMREYAKFHFTSIISDSLELISSIGEDVGLQRHEMGMLRIDEIISQEAAHKNDIILYWKRQIEKQLKIIEIHKNIKYPSLITDPNDFFVVFAQDARPNFITKLTIKAHLIYIDKNFPKNTSDLNNKIIAIEAADPGYDWIFANKIAGLITKYGGAASHMAMRCYQFEIPAAIGCGEVIFDKVRKSNIITLQCDKKIILFQ